MKKKKERNKFFRRFKRCTVSVRAQPAVASVHTISEKFAVSRTESANVEVHGIHAYLLFLWLISTPALTYFFLSFLFLFLFCIDTDERNRIYINKREKSRFNLSSSTDGIDLSQLVKEEFGPRVLDKTRSRRRIWNELNEITRILSFFFFYVQPDRRMDGWTNGWMNEKKNEGEKEYALLFLSFDYFLFYVSFRWEEVESHGEGKRLGEKASECE